MREAEMGVEGLWWFQTFHTSTGAPISGIVVLETNRILGGDSAVAIIGRFSVEGAALTGSAKTTQYNPDESVDNMFADQGSEFIEFELRQHGQELVGTVSPEGQPQVRAPLRLRFLHHLP